MREPYKNGDFVKYVGNLNMEPTRSNENTARIIKLNKHENYWLVDLEFISTGEKISCVVDVIRPILTEDIHLQKLGFEAVIDENRYKYYIKNGTILSSINIGIFPVQFMFRSSLCFGDLRNLSQEEMQKYVVNGEIDANLFNNDYPSLYNVNDLFEILESKGFVFDSKEIISC